MNGPEWVIAEMPPGYQNRVLEIKRLSEELRDMEPFARLLWESGAPLVEAVHHALTVLAPESAVSSDNGSGDLVVKVDFNRRLLVHVSGSAQPIQRKGEELARAFRLLHETAVEGDRVVLVANGQPAAKPADRTEPIEPEALKLLTRMGVNVLSTAVLFRLWKLSLEDRGRARDYLMRLSDQDGGVFIPAIT